MNQKESSLTGEEIVLGPKIKVDTDKKSRCRVINFPFSFKDGTQGVVIVCRLKDEEWIPQEDIKSLYVNFS